MSAPQPIAAGKVHAHKDGMIGWLVFDNPTRLNAISIEMLEEMADHLAGFASDDVRVVILRGAGEKAFISGGDLTQFAERRATVEDEAAYHKIRMRAWNALGSLSKPTIAMIHGLCFGGGLPTALRCDFRYASEDGVFGTPAVRRGVGYKFEDVKRLCDIVGPVSTRDILYTGRRIDAAEALRIRLVNRVVPAAQLEKAVLDLAHVLSENAPLAMRAVKLTIDEVLKLDADRDLRRCDDAVRACFASADYTEGHNAYMENRRPQFTGR